jgi:hypothetical protein
VSQFDCETGRADHLSGLKLVRNPVNLFLPL